MDGLLSFPDGEPFAVGQTPYFIGVERSVAGRLLIEVFLEGLRLVAVVDTGAPYFVCNPEFSEALSPRLADPLEETSLEIRGTRYTGRLYLLSAELQADRGQSLRVPVTAFIPNLEPGQVWRLPSFVGLTGMLDRLRFAVDPASDTFFFGPLS